jgi:hypothetical protein
MTGAISDYACILQMGDGATPENFTAIAEVVNLPPPGLDNPTAEATSHGSGGYREYISTKLKEVPEIPFDINFIPTAATHNITTGLLSKVVSGAVTNFKFIFPNVSTTTWSLSAIVSKFVPAAADAKAPKPLGGTITLRPTGTPTLS